MKCYLLIKRNLCLVCMNHHPPKRDACLGMKKKKNRNKEGEEFSKITNSKYQKLFMKNVRVKINTFTYYRVAVNKTKGYVNLFSCSPINTNAHSIQNI